MAHWLLKETGCTTLVSARFYTASEGRSGDFQGFLARLRNTTGWIVHDLPRRKGFSKCTECGQRTELWREKQVDTTLVADMVHLASTGGCDAIVLVSGDEDMLPAVDRAQRSGTRVYVAIWSHAAESTASVLVHAAFDCIELEPNAERFALKEGSEGQGLKKRKRP